MAVNNTRRTPPPLPVKRTPPLPVNRENSLPVGKESTSGNSNVIVQPNRRKLMPIPIRLESRRLNEQEYRHVLDPNVSEYYITYKGDLLNLKMLLHQLSDIRDKHIVVSIHKLTNLDDSLYLPFREIGKNIEISFNHNVEDGMDFYAFLIQKPVGVVKDFARHIDLEFAEQMIGECRILDYYVNNLDKFILKPGERITSLSKQEIMNRIFEYVCKNYPYDFSITGPGGTWTPDCDRLGGSAYQVVKRRKGVCTGRSSLIRLLANNKELNIPCYLVSGKQGQLGHQWNEFIDDYNRIIEYDASYRRICGINELPSSYRIERHEPEVKRLLK